MSDEMFQAMMIPVIATLGYWFVVKPIAWLISQAIIRFKARNIQSKESSDPI